ncbi:Hypothetical predicted protein [Podarcis lilfordi]|uniref:Uncharacterized protein n=1 Tax=Podarcis lilfordi TaxID=74358 RepID=A0AA35KDU9_9SAUR|nr:Hypothetical predicted protein [Podarcis lilfordi]
MLICRRKSFRNELELFQESEGSMVRYVCGGLCLEPCVFMKWRMWPAASSSFLKEKKGICGNDASEYADSLCHECAFKKKFWTRTDYWYIISLEPLQNLQYNAGAFYTPLPTDSWLLAVVSCNIHQTLVLS